MFNSFMKNAQAEKLSGDKLSQYPIINYSDIEQYKTTDDIFQHGDVVILLHGTVSENNGHWLLLINHPNRIEYFDPYGKKIDRMIYSDISYHTFPKLSEILLTSKKKIEYNHYPFQQYKKNINTCGRWIYLRATFRNLTLKEFEKFLGKPRYLSPDEIATLMTISL
jgi:hypothetical protein